MKARRERLGTKLGVAPEGSRDAGGRTHFGGVMKKRNGVRAIVVVGGLVGMVLGLTGCVSQSEVDRLSAMNRSLQNQNATLQREVTDLTSERDRLSQGIGRGEGTMSDLLAQNSSLKSQLDRALADYRDLQRSMSDIQFGPLDATTAAALEDLAARYPDLIAFDASRGMLRFNSDLTFASGSAEVKSEARPALQALSQVLNSPAANGYEVWIEGHTDSQRIANPATLRQHPTNRALSAHRAIAVIDQLSQFSVNPAKMMAAGWGEYRPAVANNSNGNTPANRRVEIYLARARESGASTTNVQGQPEKVSQPERGIDVTK